MLMRYAIWVSQKVIPVQILGDGWLTQPLFQLYDPYCVIENIFLEVGCNLLPLKTYVWCFAFFNK